MKQFKAVLLVLMVMILFAASCKKQSSSASVNYNQSTSVQDVLDQGTSGEKDPSSYITITEPSDGLDHSNDNTEVTESDVDIDLTVMSSTMVYAEVYNMVTNPEKYVGKTVRMEGLFTVSHDDTRDIDRYACVVMDATACCAQGIEFYLKVPADEYPGEWEKVVVVGTFDFEDQGVWRYCKLINADMSF